VVHIRSWGLWICGHFQDLCAALSVKADASALGHHFLLGLGASIPCAALSVIANVSVLGHHSLLGSGVCIPCGLDEGQMLRNDWNFPNKCSCYPIYLLFIESWWGQIFYIEVHTL